MSEGLKLGQVLGDETERDAFHVAVAPVIAAEKLAPGQTIGFVEGSTERVEAVVGAAEKERAIGIVDPFLKRLVFPDQRFYLWLFPNTVTGMRHHWQHPAFVERKPDNGVSPESKAAAEAWLRDFAGSIGLDYEEVIEVLTRCQESGGWHTFQGSDTPDRCWTDRETMWQMYQKVTGRIVEDFEATAFSCSC